MNRVFLTFFFSSDNNNNNNNNNDNNNFSGMSKSWFFDKDFSGVPDNFFEDTLGCFDFPLEDVEPNGDDGEDWESKFRHLEPPSSNLLTTFSTALCGEDASSLEPNYNSCSVLVSFIYYFIHTPYLYYEVASALSCLLSYLCKTYCIFYRLNPYS